MDIPSDTDLVERIKGARLEILELESDEADLAAQLRDTRRLLKSARKVESQLLGELARPKPMPLFEGRDDAGLSPGARPPGSPGRATPGPDPDPARGDRPEGSPPQADPPRRDGRAGGPRPGPVATETRSDYAPDYVPPGQPAGTVGHALGVRGLSETQAAAVAPDEDDWRAITLKSLIRDGKAAEFLTREYDLATVGDLHDMERDGDSLDDLGVDGKTRETLRTALLKLRADRGWGPDDGYPAAWLEPAQPEPRSDLSLWYVRPKKQQAPVYAIRCRDRDQAEAYVRSQHPANASIEILDAGQAKAANLSIPLDLWVRTLDQAEPINVFQCAPEPADTPDSRSVACPHCGAAAGKPCFGGKGPTTPTHAARHQAAQRQARKTAKRAEIAAKREARQQATTARGQKALRRQIQADGRQAAAALEATP